MIHQRTVAEMIADRQSSLSLTDETLARAAGYTNGRVVEMIKAGRMMLPINKAVPFADALQLDREEFFGAVLEESAPGLLQVIGEVFAPLRLTEAERNLVQRVRRLAGNREVRPIVFDGPGVVALVTVGK